MSQGMVFEDIFNVKDIDPNGKQFDRGKQNNFYMITLIYLVISHNIFLAITS